MSLGILKFIGLGVIGIGGAGTAIIFGSKQVRESLGLSSSSPTPSITPASPISSVPEVSLSEVDQQYQLLYRLSKKIFENTSKISTSDAYGKDNVIKWLKDKFSSSLSDETDKWENFKSLCEEQKTKETQEGKNVNNEHARLCFVDTGANSKGYLFNWYGKSNLQISPEIQIDFLDFNKKNYDLWIEFKSQYPSSNPIDKFDEWFNSAEGGDVEAVVTIASTGVSLFKKVIDKLKVRISSV